MRVDKVMLPASQICGFKDYTYGKYEKSDWNTVYRHWIEIRKMIKKARLEGTKEEPVIPSQSIYLRFNQEQDKADMMSIRQKNRYLMERAEEGKSETNQHSEPKT